MASRHTILGLYRRCIRSANQIPEAGQRLTYLNHVRDGFHRKAKLPRDSREAISAYRDGEEQVVQMEYYQRMANAKKSNGANTISSQSTKSSDEVNALQRNAAAPTETSQSEVMSWLISQLPHLHTDDAERYCQCLVNDGFDSVPFIEEELVEDDLGFMKKAHKRVLLRQLQEKRTDK